MTVSCFKEEWPQTEGDICFTATIPWTYALDVDRDHDLFYMGGQYGLDYARKSLPLEVDACQLKKFSKKHGLNLYNLVDRQPVFFKVYSTDALESGVPSFKKEDKSVIIKNLAMNDGQLCLDIAHIEWDKVYKAEARYQFGDDEVTAVFILTTVDRNREWVELPLREYTFTLNAIDMESGNGYKDGYYFWKSDFISDDIKEAFLKPGKSSRSVVKPEDLEYLNTGEKNSEGVYEGKLLEINFTSYSGQVITVPIKINYKER